MSLPWDRFRELEGAPERNFELVWRGVVQKTWEQFGQLVSHRQQPGVEFHLRLHSGCDLGEDGRWYGWQCRWYTLRADNKFRAAQRADIRKSVETTREILPGLTDYVLCLRERPASSDISWYFGLAEELSLPENFRLLLWDQEDLEPRLTGAAEVLSATYFGELVLTASDLALSRERALAPVRDRWMPQVNIEVEAGRDLAAALLRPGSLTSLRKQCERLADLTTDITEGHEPLPPDLLADVEALAETVRAVASRLGEVVAAAETADPGFARELLECDIRPDISPGTLRRLAHALRARRHPAALPASAAEAEIRQAIRLVARQRELTNTPVLAVIADPGRGKSHLSAELTETRDGVPAGVFIAGRDLRKGGTLDELAERVPGLPARGIDELLEAVDAAGARAGARIPIVIDGLNEAERPHEWQTQLLSIAPVLPRYRNLALIVTLRGAVKDDVLIEAAVALTLHWTDDDVRAAIRRYFSYYKIEPVRMRLPFWLFGDPLFLRLFCEAVNPDREHSVGAESIPGDFVAVFELFREKLTDRLGQRLGLRPKLIVRKLASVALTLWERRARDLPFEEVQEIVNEPETAWETSLVRALEQEGVFSRDPDQTWDDQRTAVLFDRFAGYLVADALLRERGADATDEFLDSPELWSALTGEAHRRHPLAEDIWLALVGLVPRQRHGRQLWRFASSDAGARTLTLTLDLASDFIDGESQTALAEFIAESCSRPNSFDLHPFDSLWAFRDSPAHRLNALFLDRVLRLMPLPTRDAGWTEWLRVRAEHVRSAINDATAAWTATEARGAEDDLDARALAWVSTSTNRALRDGAARALQRYGRPDPRRVFELTFDLAEVDDPYVQERLLGASLGAACTHQMPDPAGGFTEPLGTFLGKLAEWFFEPNATRPTSNVMIRDYVRTLVEFSAALHPDVLPGGIEPGALNFTPGPEPQPAPEDSEIGREANRTIHMDFGNYTIGSLYEDRGNYQFEHADYQRGLAEVRGRVWELGWRQDRFEQIDSRIAEDAWRGGRGDGEGRTERYGKKLGWIAYHELAGRLSDSGRLRTRGWYRHEASADIDPTFPESPPPVPIVIPTWASQPPEGDREWHVGGPVDVPDDLLIAQQLDEENGPWVLIDGYLAHRDRSRGREVWGFLRSMLAAEADGDELATMLETRAYLGNDFVPSAPSHGSMYGGEIPWSRRFLDSGDLGWNDPPYVAHVGRYGDGLEIEVELLSHEYRPELRSPVEDGSGAYVPSALLARAFDLRQRPGRLDLIGLDGRSASRSFAAPDGFEGHLLFIREDIIAEYANGRPLIQLAWGERQILFDWPRVPDWMREVGEHDDLWRRVELRRFGADGASN